MLPFIIIFAVAAAALGAWSASTALEARTRRVRSMQAVERYQVVDTREQEMLESVTDRIIAPVGRRMVDLARGVTPAGYVEKLKRNIVFAGSPPGYAVDRILVGKVLGGGVRPALDRARPHASSVLPRS